MPFLNTNGNKAALIIGINYIGMDGELNGCINDAKNIKHFLIDKCNYTELSIFMLTEETKLKPTKENILKAINNFVLFIKNNNIKEAWFSYSGHGSYEFSSKENDNQNESLVPLDYKESGCITDNELYKNLVKNIPLNCKLFSIVDACHSGTSLDLPFLYRLDKGIVQQSKSEKLANIIKISGCRDYQTSMDAHLLGEFQGALTTCFLKTINDLNFNFTCKQLIKQINNYIRGGDFEQIPTVSFTDEKLINEIVMGENNPYFEDCNVELSFKGDAWCHSETNWNLFSSNKGNFIFSENLNFYTRNETVKMQLNLQPGNYKLIFNDTYGDGGVNEGYIKDITNDKILKEIEFNNGNKKTIDFTVVNVKKSEEEHSISITVIGDRWSAYETNWNIVDNEKNELFDTDYNFSKEIYYTINTKLKEGSYKIKCKDTWGDGGMSGIIKKDNKIIKRFNFETSKLQFFDFRV